MLDARRVHEGWKDVTDVDLRPIRQFGAQTLGEPEQAELARCIATANGAGAQAPSEMVLISTPRCSEKKYGSATWAPFM
jgi:hypothetical protein